ncbi:MAG: PD-(D/E)XK nuclease family protein [Candidatus Zixiibacteriota bacterium]
MAVYSYSRINCYFTCPRQYKFKYIDKPQIEKKTGIEAFMGSMVHEALERCYHLVESDKPPTRDELDNIYRNCWEENLPENLSIVREDMTVDDYFAIGRKALRWYHDEHYPFDGDITLGLERRVDISLDGDGQYRMQGYIDRLARDKDGRLIIQDYKTGRQLPTQAEVDEDGQLALYQLAVEDMWPDNNGIVLRRYFLRFNTPLESRRTPEQLVELKQEYIRKIRLIEKAIDLKNFPTNESPLCDWCEYNEICPAKGGTGVAEPQEELPLVTGEPLQDLVDEYIALDVQKKEIGRRLDEIKDLLVRAAEHDNKERIEGKTAGAILITHKSIEKLPTKSANPVVFREIEDLIKGAGLFEQFGALDMRALQKAFDDIKLPESVYDTLSQWTEKQNSPSIKITANKKGA